jgi:predicted double-glycine peptidase
MNADYLRGARFAVPAAYQWDASGGAISDNIHSYVPAKRHTCLAQNTRDGLSSLIGCWGALATYGMALLPLVALLINAASAFAGESGRKPVRSLFEIRHDGVIVQEWETSCAAAALATVLTFSLSDPVSEKFVAQRMLHSTDPIRVKVRGGFSLLDMKHFVESRGFKGAGFKGLSFERLLALQSPIVPIDFYGNPHFVVVRGLSDAGQVQLADPAFGNHSVSVEDFNSVWKDGIGFVVTR